MTATDIKIKDAAKKIEYTKLRIEQFINWDADKKYKNLKDHCINRLRERVVFLEEHAIWPAKKFNAKYLR